MLYERNTDLLFHSAHVYCHVNLYIITERHNHKRKQTKQKSLELGRQEVEMIPLHLWSFISLIKYRTNYCGNKTKSKSHSVKKTRNKTLIAKAKRIYAHIQTCLCEHNTYNKKILHSTPRRVQNNYKQKLEFVTNELLLF